MAGNRSRLLQVMPTTKPPIRSCIERFSVSDRRILMRFISEAVDCVFQPKFSSVRTEKVLFGDRSDQALRVVAAPKAALRSDRLSGSEEVLLFERYNYARYRILLILKQYAGKRLPVKVAREILHWGRLALGSRTQIIQANIPLVLSMAQRSRLDGLDFGEMISEGNLALIRSVEKFDVSRGFKFSTYSCRAILKSFSRVAMQTGRYRGMFPAELNQELEPDDFVELKRAEIEEGFVNDLKHVLSENLAELNEVERKVLKERFALGTLIYHGHAKTLEQVGQLVGVTKERVRQIQNKAMAKVRIVLEDQIAAA